MPTYDYECREGHRFEVFQKMTEEPVAECPECGAAAARKISGGAGFLFKGEGFYITDYRSEDYKKQASKESGSSDEASKEPGSSDKASKSKEDKGSTSSSKAAGGASDSGPKSSSDG